MLLVKTIENNLKTSDKHYYFMSAVNQTLNIDELAREMARRNTTLTEADARAALIVLSETVNDFVQRGYRVELPFGYMELRAHGTTDRMGDVFKADGGDNRLSVSFRMKKSVSSAITKKAEFKMAKDNGVSRPEIKSTCIINDSGKSDECKTFKNGDVVRLRGERLHIDAGDEKQGVFIEDTQGNKLKVKKYFRTGSRIVDIALPSCASGVYHVGIITHPAIRRYETSVFFQKITVT